jgi:esterase FrsA
MAFTFDAAPRSLISERRDMWIGHGTAPQIIDEVHERLNDELWTYDPGSWTYEWARVAKRAEDEGDFLAAALRYGIGKYPTLANDVHQASYDNSLRCYLEASATFPLPFERRYLELDYRGTKVVQPVHIFTQPERPSESPVILTLGGIDTWKIDIHNSVVGLAKRFAANVVAIDGPGVAESPVPSTADGDRLLRAIIDQIRPLGDGVVAVVGWSFGGTWAAKLALTGEVDAAVACGGLVEHGFSEESIAGWPNGVPGVLENSLWLDQPYATAAELADAVRGFRLSEQGLLGEWTSTTPLLVVNGDEDPYVPTLDVTLFDGRPNTVTRVVKGAGHCVAGKVPETLPGVFEWLEQQLTTPSATTAAA